MGTGRTLHIRLSYFTVPMGTSSSLSARRRERRLLKNMRGCFRSSARSKKCGACQTKRSKDRGQETPTSQEKLHAETANAILARGASQVAQEERGGNMKFKGQSAVVVGGSRGFGRGGVGRLIASGMTGTAGGPDSPRPGGTGRADPSPPNGPR